MVKMSRTVTKVLDYGVEFRNVWPPDVVRNSEIRNVVLVDFEQSLISRQLPVVQEKHLYLYHEASRKILLERRESCS